MLFFLKIRFIFVYKERTMKKITIYATMSAFILSGCASSPEDIEAQYVSPVSFQSYNCQQIFHELAEIKSREAYLYDEQEDHATGDAVAVGIGLTLFWPALFFLMDGDKESQISRIKGEYQALEKVSRDKGCGGNRAHEAHMVKPQQPNTAVTSPKLDVNTQPQVNIVSPVSSPSFTQGLTISSDTGQVINAPKPSVVQPRQPQRNPVVVAPAPESTLDRLLHELEEEQLQQQSLSQ